MSKKQMFPVILASASPRRRQLLAEAGYQFTVVHPEINESALLAGQDDPAKYAEQLALAKAKSVARKYPDSLVIGADTIVDHRGRVVGKPADAKEARQIVQRLFNAPHKVITGLAICRFSDDMELITHDSTTVYPRKLTKKQIDEHIKGNSWKDKSGAYAIKEDGDEFIERINGSLTNVMGLPMELLEDLLSKIASKE